MSTSPRYPGIRVVANGNQLIASMTEARVADAGVFYPITPSTEMGELFQQAFAEGKLNVFGNRTLAIEAEGEHAAQGGAIAASITGRRVVNFTSGQGLVYGLEQYYHAPGKLSTMVVQCAARALTKHALNVHCGHDDFYAALDTGWIILVGKDAQQAADQALILRRVTELALNPGINVQDGFLTSHLERTFFMHEAELIREFLGAADDVIPCPTPAQRELFGPTRRRVPEVIDLKNPAVIGPVQNQEHYMQGVIARRNNFSEPILGFLEESFERFAELTGRKYGLVTEHKCEGADTVFLTLGSAAENIEAAVDWIEKTHGERVGSIHLNVLRPFPEAALARALAGKKNVIVLERVDDAMSGDNALARDVRTTLGKALESWRAQREGAAAAPGAVPPIAPDDQPTLFRGSYGLGSRDFRPEHVLGAWQYATGKIARTDGKSAKDGERYFVLGVPHPYAVVSASAPSLLPEKAIAVRLHSIGGWGMITTGKNLGMIVGNLGESVARERGLVDANGLPAEVLHVSANPKYGSEKKGAPTAYFLVVAPERIRVNCDLRHVDVVLCCDPKAFTHSNPLQGVQHGGAFVWESDDTPEKAWMRIPRALRREVVEKDIRLFILPGFEIARRATDRPDLQLRMQGNAFLGAFFAVSSFLGDYNISKEKFRELVREQYVKKFGRLGDAVVASNMAVMDDGFTMVRPVPYGELHAEDRSAMRGKTLLPVVETLDDVATLGRVPPPQEQPARPNLTARSYFDGEFRAGLGYDQPASALASVGVIASATGATTSKYVARRATPVFIAENCTQCMACIAACPDTALLNTSQELSTVLATAVRHYVSDAGDRKKLVGALPGLEQAARARMGEIASAGKKDKFADLVRPLVEGLAEVSHASRTELQAALEAVPVAFQAVKPVFSLLEKAKPGTGGVFSIVVNDLCKGCGECVVECGDKQALKMSSDSEELNARGLSAQAFFELLPQTPTKFLGKYDDNAPEKSRPATLRNHLMVQKNYGALVSGDGACAGCGEKSVLHTVASITEAYMRPIYHARAARLEQRAAVLKERGAELLGALATKDPEAYALYARAVAHLILGLGGESDADTGKRVAATSKKSDRELVDALVTVLRQDAFNHRYLQAVDGRLANGMAVMAMGAHTGCNTVYGSTSPATPHPYPWMNSLFQDGATISWLLGESFILDHARRSVIPERLADALLDKPELPLSKDDYFELTHLDDTRMTDREVHELPRVWCIGGDGAMGDIGFQNVSKVVLQNRPNVKLLMLDTQVYSNTGGQNSDSSVLTGGFDMNQMGAATQGKLTEKKSVAEAFTVGHGSPFVAQLSMADEQRLYESLLRALEYRGTAFFQSFTTCQPEHGVGDDMASTQARRARDSRGVPQFVYDPQKGETSAEVLDLGGNLEVDRDWREIRRAKDGGKHWYTVAHWATTEARFRRHVKPLKEEQAKKLTHLDDLLCALTMDDLVWRRFLDEKHRAYVPDFGAYLVTEEEGELAYYALSRQMVLFCVERRKAWRQLQSRAGVVNRDYRAQRALLQQVAAGTLTRADLWARGRQLLLELRDKPA
ncbi:MAG: 2-oxoacid:acceptor oxidoreductase family protein [Deltaproteobacteria bacterium]|nr:2-oxoacid:acceptor oxidoreductase family protein [Deltaproteobacteria bacterium]